MPKNPVSRSWGLYQHPDGSRRSYPSSGTLASAFLRDQDDRTQSIDFGWTVPENHGLGSINEGVEGTRDLAQYAIIPPGQTGVYTKTAGPSQATVNPSTGLLTVAPGLAIGSYSVTVDVSNAAEADWLARKSAAGVIRATDFRDSEIALFNKGKVTGTAFPERVTRDQSGVALTGGACLRIDIPANAGSDSGAWKCFLDQAWDGLNIDAAQGSVGMNNTAFYVQFRLRFPPTWLDQAAGTDQGKKVTIVSSNFHTSIPMEHVIQNIYNRGVVQAYHQDGSGFVNFEQALPPFDVNLQNMIPGPNYCRWTNGATTYPNCYLFTPDVWMCLYMRIKAGTYGGSAGNEWDLWGWMPGESGYTHLQSYQGYTIGSVGQYTNGFNGIHLLPYTTNRTSGPADSHVLYDQLIVSTQPIACPTV